MDIINSVFFRQRILNTCRNIVRLMDIQGGVDEDDDINDFIVAVVTSFDRFDAFDTFEIEDNIFVHLSVRVTLP